MAAIVAIAIAMLPRTKATLVVCRRLARAGLGQSQFGDVCPEDLLQRQREVRSRAIRRSFLRLSMRTSVDWRES